MKMSSRAKRMLRRHLKGQKRDPNMNIISLIDIMSVLVLFLLVHSSEVEVLPNPNEIRVPESIAEAQPDPAVVVMVTRHEVLVQGRPVISLDDLKMSADAVIKPLEAALREQQEFRVEGVTAKPQDPVDRAVTVLADRDTPYSVLKKVLATCTASEFGKVSFAVTQKEAKPLTTAAM
ncbi:MAG: biopolymer transporter ExbD [Steroidobacteraceae bacterium]